MHRLPPTDSPLWQRFDKPSLIAIGTNQVTPPTIAQAVAKVVELAEGLARDGARSVNYLATNPENGHLVLLDVALDTSHTILWDFNQPSLAPVYYRPVVGRSHKYRYAVETPEGAPLSDWGKQREAVQEVGRIRAAGGKAKWRRIIPGTVFVDGVGLFHESKEPGK